jgi:hypothetical protein
MATYFDAYGNPIKPKSSGLIVPLVLLVLASGGANYWLWKERSKTTAQAFEATAKLAASEAMQKEMAQKIQMFDTDRAALVEARDQAVKDAKEKSLELAKLKDDVAGVEVPNEPEKEGAADDKGKAGAKGKDAKETPAKTDKKPEPKTKAKAKPKKKTSETSHKKESAKDTVEREL